MNIIRRLATVSSGLCLGSWGLWWPCLLAAVKQSLWCFPTCHSPVNNITHLPFTLLSKKCVLYFLNAFCIFLCMQTSLFITDEKFGECVIYCKPIILCPCNHFWVNFNDLLLYLDFINSQVENLLDQFWGQIFLYLTVHNVIEATNHNKYF